MLLVLIALSGNVHGNELSTPTLQSFENKTPAWEYYYETSFENGDEWEYWLNSKDPDFLKK